LILNLGCGNSTYGDIRCDIVRTLSSTHVCDATRLPFQNATFNEVFESNLLEHLPNPATHLLEVARVLKRNGRLVLITDNASCLKAYVLGTHTGHYHKSHNSTNTDDKHYALFTKAHLQNLLSYTNSFKILSMELVDTDYFTVVFDKLVRLVLPQLSYPRIKVVALRL
jgi:2-polyprenyl-3-methyl-5-hydroxy-6-metoxy-1,4-benzoquinol methylase